MDKSNNINNSPAPNNDGGNVTKIEVVENSGAGEASDNKTEKRAEKSELISEAIRKSLGESANLLVQIDGQDQINLVTLTEKTKEEKKRLAYEASEAWAKNQTGEVKQKEIKKQYKKAEKALKKNKDINEVYEMLGIERAQDADALNLGRAREIVDRGNGLEEISGDKGQDIALFSGETIKKTETNEKVDGVVDALSELFAEYKKIGKSESAEARDDAYKQAREKFDEALKENGTQNIDGLDKIADVMKDVAAVAVSQNDVKKYLENHVALYEAKMQEGLVQKRDIDKIYQSSKAKAAKSIAQSYAMMVGKSIAKTKVIAVLGYGTSVIAGATLPAAAAAVSAGAIVGGGTGALRGLIRGRNEAKHNLNIASTDAAESGEELLTAEEREEREEANGEIDGDESISDSDERKMGRSEKKLEPPKDEMEEKLDRKSAKELYDSLDELISKSNEPDTKNKIEDVLAEIRARSGVSAENDIDLIKFSKGRSDRERKLLADKMVEAEKTLRDLGEDNPLEKITELAKQKAEKFEENYEEYNKLAKEYKTKIIWDRVKKGAGIGAISGAIAGTIGFGIKQSGIIDYVYERIPDPIKEFATDRASAMKEFASKIPLVGGFVNPDTVADDVNSNYAAPKFHTEIDEDGGMAVFADTNGDGKLEQIVGVGDARGIEFDADGRIIENDAVEQLRDAGFDIKEIAQNWEGKGTETISVGEYFNSDNEDITEVTHRSWLTDGNGNTMVDIDQSSIIRDPETGDITMQILSRGDGDVDLDDLQLYLTADKTLDGAGLAFDVDADGLVTIPGDSVAASDMFDAEMNFQGGFGEIIRPTDTDGTVEVLATSLRGAENLTDITVPADITTYSYVITADAGNTRVGTVSASLYEQITSRTAEIDTGESFGFAETGASVEAYDADGDVIKIDRYDLYGDYNQNDDVFYGKTLENGELLLKDEEVASGTSVVKEFLFDEYSEMVDAGELSDDEINSRLGEMFKEKIDSGEIDKGDVVETWWRNVCSSPENIVSERARMGELEWAFSDVNGDGVVNDLDAVAVDTQEKINELADIINRDPEAYREFVNDTTDLFYDRVQGSTLNFYAYNSENPYQYSSWAKEDSDGNILQHLTRKRPGYSGTGFEFVKNGKSALYDEDAIRTMYKIPSNQEIVRIGTRLDCDQETVSIREIGTEMSTATSVETASVSQTATSAVPTTQVTTTVVDSTPPTDQTPIPETTPIPSPEPGPGPGPEPAPSPSPEPLVGKTDTNPWIGDNPSTQPVTPSFEAESAANGDASIIQAGQEDIPEVDTSGVNMNPADQQDWAEAPTAPIQDTGTGGLVDQSATSDVSAAAILARTEEELAAERTAQAAAAQRAAEEAAQRAAAAAAQQVSPAEGGGGS